MPRTVTIVCANGETLDQLQSYLVRAGVSARSSRSIDMLDPHPSVLVLFPDEFSIDEVLGRVEWFRERAQVLSVIVTAHPNRFSAIAKDHAIVVIPKPAWAWTILDAIHSLWGNG